MAKPKPCPIGDHPKGGCRCLSAEALKASVKNWDIDSVQTAFNAANNEGRSNAAATLRGVLAEKAATTEVRKSDE